MIIIGDNMIHLRIDYSVQKLYMKKKIIIA